MTKLTGVGFVLSVGHDSPEGARHGHSYDVTVWYRFGYDARALQRQAEVVRLKYDHAVLPAELSLGESLAEQIGKELPGCVAVDCNRPLERLFARWEA